MRLIDGDALLTGRQDHDFIDTHIIYNAPTIDAIPISFIWSIRAEAKDTALTALREGDYDLHWLAVSMQSACDVVLKRWAERRTE